jgi:hypothetical protein
MRRAKAYAGCGKTFGYMLSAKYVEGQRFDCPLKLHEAIEHKLQARSIIFGLA